MGGVQKHREGWRARLREDLRMHELQAGMLQQPLRLIRRERHNRREQRPVAAEAVRDGAGRRQGFGDSGSEARGSAGKSRFAMG